MGTIAGDTVLGQHPPAAWTLSDTEVVACLDKVFAAEQTLAAQRLALIAEIDGRGLATRDGATSTAAWLRERLRLDTGPARRMARLAQTVHTNLSATAQALADADIHEDQAHAIAHAIQELPTDINQELRGQAEKTLVELAGQFAPAQLRLLGTRGSNTSPHKSPKPTSVSNSNAPTPAPGATAPSPSHHTAPAGYAYPAGWTPNPPPSSRPRSNRCAHRGLPPEWVTSGPRRSDAPTHSCTSPGWRWPVATFPPTAGNGHKWWSRLAVRIATGTTTMDDAIASGSIINLPVVQPPQPTDVDRDEVGVTRFAVPSR